MIIQLFLKVIKLINKAKPFFFTEKKSEKKSIYNLFYPQTQTSLFKNKSIKSDFSPSFLSKRSSKNCKTNTSSNKHFKTDENYLSSTNSNTNISIQNLSKNGFKIKLGKYST